MDGFLEKLKQRNKMLLTSNILCGFTFFCLRIISKNIFKNETINVLTIISFVIFFLIQKVKGQNEEAAVLLLKFFASFILVGQDKCKYQDRWHVNRHFHTRNAISLASRAFEMNQLDDEYCNKCYEDLTTALWLQCAQLLSESRVVLWHRY